MNYREHVLLDRLLKLKSLANSKSEVTSIASAFIECLQFLIIKNSSDVDMCKSLIKNQLVSITEWCITDKVSYYKPIFYQIAMFVQYLSRSNNPVSLQSLVNFYFDNVQQIVGNLLEPDLNIAIISERQIELVRSLKHSHRPKKLSHVTFMLSDDEKIHSDKKGPANARQNETYFKLIDQLAVNIFQEYTKYVTAKSSRHLVDQMCSLVMEFSNNEAMFFDSLNIKFMDIYENLFKKWLMSDEIYCKSVINLIFLLITYLDDHEKEIVLNDLSKNNQSNCLMWSISTALSYPYIESTVVQKWLREEKIGKFFISIAEKQITDECSPELGAILKLALTENRNGDIFITKDVLTQIIEKIWSTLLADKDKVENLDSCSRLASHLCSIIYTDTLLLTYGDQLLLTLIQTTCKFQHENDSLSLETICEIKSAWQDALIILLSNLPMSDSEMIVSQIAVTIEDQFFLTSVTDKEQMKHLASVIVMCISAFCKSQSHMVSSLIDIIFKRTWTARGKTIEQICKIAEYVKGTMGSPYEELVLPDSLNEKEILQYFIWCFIKLYTLSSELNVSSQFDGSPIVDDDCEDLPSHERLIDVIKTEENYLLHALYFHSVGKSFLTHFTNVKYYKEIHYYNSWVEERLRELFLSINKDTVTELKAELKNKCFKFGWFWCQAAFDFYTGFSDEMTCSSAICNEVIEHRSDTSPLGVVHVNQTFKNDELSTDLSSENVKDTAGRWMDQMQTLKQENIPEFLYDNPYKVSWEKAEKIIESVRLCSKLIEHCPLSRTYWDFVVISLASWVSNCLKARELVHSKYQYQAMLISISELYVNICDKVAKFKEFNENTNFVNEWEDVLLETIHDDFAQIWLYLAERLPTESENTIINLPFLQYFGPITERLRHDFIFKSKDNFPKWTKFLKKGCSLLTNSRTILQLWGYRMLKILIPGLVKIDYEAVDNRTPHEKGLIFEQFKDKLTEVQIVVNSVLMDFRVGENTCRVEPSYDSFTYTVAYLLLWDVMLSLSEEASAELRYQYAEWLKNGKFLNYFLSNLFKLIPPEIYQSNEGKTKFNDCFLESPLDYTSSYNKFFDSETIEQMVCYLYKTSLVQLPALVRQWWTDLEVKASQLVDKITTIYVSPHLCLEELNNVVNHQNAFKNMKVKVMITIREILAVYTVDETQMELTITLPLNYPLGSPTIQCNKQISGANQKQWLLQFKKCVLHQNGRIWDGLSLWNNNLDRKFDGVEECFICYAVLHYGTCQLPKLCCQTCKKKFHSACLYKWFSTSNKSSCPICRNLF